MELEGKVILDLGMTSGTSKAGNAWKKREIIVETFGTYPRKVKMTLFGDRADNIKAELGNSYVFSIDVESREYMGRWYTDVSVYGSRDLASNPPVAPTNETVTYTQTTTTTQTETVSDPFTSDESDDLPF